MGGVDLHAGEAALLGQLRAAREALLDFADIRLGHLARHRKLLGQRAQRQRNGRRRQRRLPERGRHLAPRMVDLHPRMRAVRTRHLGPAAEALEMRAVFEDDAVRAGHGAVVDHHVAGQDQARATCRPRLIQAQQRVGRRVIGIGHVFFHGGFGKAIWDHRAVGQNEGREELHGGIRVGFDI